MNWNTIIEIALGVVFSNLIMLLGSLLVDYFWVE